MKISFTDRELDVMAVLWRKGSGTVAEVRDALPTEFAVGSGKIVPFLHPGRATLAMLVWMALWWMTETVDIEVTALLPLVAFPLAGIMSIEEATAPYSSSVVYLFLGGFILALAIQRCGLDRRIAFLTLRLVGTTPGLSLIHI